MWGLKYIYAKCTFDFSVLFADSDSDNFQSLKKASKPKQNDATKQTKPDVALARPRVKGGPKSPPKPSATRGRTTAKSPVTPKSTSPPPPPLKQTPTSVLDYFGNAAVQRSDKKLVASTKRKAVSASSSKPPSFIALWLLSAGSHPSISLSPPRRPMIWWVMSKSPNSCRWMRTWWR